MIRIGIGGFGLMGRVHLKSFAADSRAQVTAVADPRGINIEEVAGNIDGMAAGSFDPKSIRSCATFEELLRDPAIDAVSICTPTPDHVRMTIAALEAGKHVLVEKPLGLTSVEADLAVAAAGRFPHLVAMPAMCMRFWPAWAWLREAIRTDLYGSVHAASFVRIGSMPTWATFYGDAAKSGGAILDLHIHDVDFVRFCFGDPDFVEATGYSETTAGVDHVMTKYRYSRGPAIVSTEGGWSMKPGFQFTMRYLVNFERATATFDFQSKPQLRVTRADGNADSITLPEGEGYLHEVRHFLDCIEHRRQPTVVSMRDGAEAVRLVECERESVKRGQPVRFRRGS